MVDRIALTQVTETDYYIPHAHNIYAQTAAEHGLLGLLAGALVIGCLAWLILGGLRDPDAVRRRWGWAALFAAVYFGAHQILDFYANMPAALFAFALPITWLDATAPRSITARLPAPAMGPAIRRLLGGVAAMAAAVILTVSVVGLVAQETPAQAMGDGQIAAGRGDWVSALPLFRAANDADPAMCWRHVCMGMNPLVMATLIGDDIRATSETGCTRASLGSSCAGHGGDGRVVRTKLRDRLQPADRVGQL